MALPPDVLEYVLGFLQSDTTALRACSESHPILSKLAERYLYVTIAVHDGAYTSKQDEAGFRVHEFTQLLSDMPSIANYVRNLSLCINTDKPPHKLQELVEFSCLLPLLSRLKTIALRGTGSSAISWAALPDTFRRDFLDCINMKEISLDHIRSFQLSHLNNCNAVTLSRLQIPEHNRNSRSALQLKSMCIEDCHSLFSIRTWVKTLNLRSLKLFISSFETSEFQWPLIPEFLAECPKTLVNLELNIKNKLRSSYNFSATAELGSDLITATPFSISRLHELENLTIGSELKFLYSGVRRRFSPEPQWSLHSAVPSIKHVITTAAPSLKYLTLDFHAFFSANCCRLPDPDVLWPSLASLVAECSDHSIKVEINIFCETLGSERIPAGMVCASLNGSTQLMQYADMGVLVIAPDVYNAHALEEETTSNLPCSKRRLRCDI